MVVTINHRRPAVGGYGEGVLNVSLDLCSGSNMPASGEAHLEMRAGIGTFMLGCKDRPVGVLAAAETDDRECRHVVGCTDRPILGCAAMKRRPGREDRLCQGNH